MTNIESQSEKINEISEWPEWRRNPPSGLTHESAYRAWNNQALLERQNPSFNSLHLGCLSVCVLILLVIGWFLIGLLMTLPGLTVFGAVMLIALALVLSSGPVFCIWVDLSIIRESRSKQTTPFTFPIAKNEIPPFVRNEIKVQVGPNLDKIISDRLNFTVTDDQVEIAIEDIVVHRTPIYECANPMNEVMDTVASYLVSLGNDLQLYIEDNLEAPSDHTRAARKAREAISKGVDNLSTRIKYPLFRKMAEESEMGSARTGIESESTVWKRAVDLFVSNPLG